MPIAVRPVAIEEESGLDMCMRTGPARGRAARVMVAHQCWAGFLTDLPAGLLSALLTGLAAGLGASVAADFASTPLAAHSRARGVGSLMNGRNWLRSVVGASARIRAASARITGFGSAVAGCSTRIAA